jgi:hypothetical protein
MHSWIINDIFQSKIECQTCVNDELKAILTEADVV